MKKFSGWQAGLGRAWSGLGSGLARLKKGLSLVQKLNGLYYWIHARPNLLRAWPEAQPKAHRTSLSPVPALFNTTPDLIPKSTATIIS